MLSSQNFMQDLTLYFTNKASSLLKIKIHNWQRLKYAKLLLKCGIISSVLNKSLIMKTFQIKIKSGIKTKFKIS